MGGHGTPKVGWLRNNEAYRACVAELDRRGIAHHLEDGSKHAKLVFTVNGRRMFKLLSRARHRPAHEIDLSLADVRRMIREAERPPPDGTERPPVRAQSLAAQPAPAPSQTFEKDRTMHDTVPASAASIPLTLNDLAIRSGEARVRDLIVAKRLGFSDPHSIRRIIDGNRQSLERFGELISEADRKSGAGRPSNSFYLNKRQALFVTAKSNTPAAADVTVAMVEVFDRHLQASLPKPGHELSPDDATVIGGIVKAVVIKQTADLRASNDLMLERIAQLSAQVDAMGRSAGALAAPVRPAIANDHVTALQVVTELAGVPAERRYRGLTSWVTAGLLTACQRANVLPHLIEMHPGKKWAYPHAVAEKWLAAGGKDRILTRVERHHARISDQKQLRLTGGRSAAHP
jgi:hypothetical protein